MPAIENIIEAKKNTNKAIPKQQRSIIIWDHGTLGLSKTASPTFFKSIPGLWHTNMYTKGNSLFDVGTTLTNNAPDQFPQEDLYFFGWSGKLSIEARIEAAEELYDLILAKRDEYIKKDGVAPKIQIITHSHGGNVALHLAEVQNRRNRTFIVDELILLACPVQERTKPLIQDPMFKHIISFYSKLDLIQILDPQGLQDMKKIWLGTKKRNSDTPFFSERRFPDQNNLTQVQVKINGRAITHLEFILKKFVRRLPLMIEELRVEKNWQL